MPNFYLIWQQNGTLLQGVDPVSGKWTANSLVYPVSFPGTVSIPQSATLRSSARDTNTLETLSGVKIYLTGDPNDIATVQSQWPYLGDSYVPYNDPINLLTPDVSNSGTWAYVTGGVASLPIITSNFGVAPDGTKTATRVQLAINGGRTSTDQSSVLSGSPTNTVGLNYAFNVWIMSNSGPVNVSVETGSGVPNIVPVDGTWRRFSGPVFAGTGVVNGSPQSVIRLRGYATPTSDTADLLVWHPQLATTVAPLRPTIFSGQTWDQLSAASNHVLFAVARPELNGGVEISFDQGRSYTRFSNEAGLESNPATWLTLPAVSVGLNGIAGQLGPFDQAHMLIRFNIPQGATLYKVPDIRVAADFDIL